MGGEIKSGIWNKSQSNTVYGRNQLDRKTGQTLSESKFNACIPLQPKRTDLAENGKEYLKTVQALFDTATGKLTEEPAQGNETLTPENAYLHIQGHQLYKLLLHIGTLLCKGAGIAFRTDILDKGLHTTGYDEIELLQNDLKAILDN